MTCATITEEKAQPDTGEWEDGYTKVMILVEEEVYHVRSGAAMEVLFGHGQESNIVDRPGEGRG